MLKMPAMSDDRRPVAKRAPLPALAVLIGRLVARAAAWLGPVALRAARASVPATARLGRATLRGLASMRRAAVRRRDLLVALACRAAWWGSLAIFAAAGATLLAFTVETVDGLWHPFAIGLCMCTLVVLVARERHLRWLATVLGTSHAVLGLLAFGALQG